MCLYACKRVSRVVAHNACEAVAGKPLALSVLHVGF